jgi:hypothetical protein
MKPLFRWIIGNCLPQGIDVLAESIRVTTRTLGENSWDWAVCYNGLSKDEVDLIRAAIGMRPIELVAQNWVDCPVEDHVQSPRRSDGSFEWNGTKCGGTLWKVCPPRMRLDAHEIIMDNDVVLLRKFPQIDEWLQSNKTLILEEKIRFYGRYDHLFAEDEPNLNSGFMGLPPGYDFGFHIKNTWQEHGSLMGLSQADEQALLTFTLSQYPNIRVSQNQMIEILAREHKIKITGEESGIHFTQVNRIPKHRAWIQYQKIMKSKSERAI